MKHFIVNPGITHLSKQKTDAIQKRDQQIFSGNLDARLKLNEEKINEVDYLKHVEGRIVIKIDDRSKDFHVMGNGARLEMPRRFNNLNSRYTFPVNAFVIDAAHISKDSQVLIHHHCVHDTYRIFNYKDNHSDVRYYSIPEEMCFAYYNGKEWQPMATYDFALRIFEPYSGKLLGIDPKELKEVLWATTGKYKNKVVQTLKACDYEIVFNDINGRESNLIRFRPDGNEKLKMEAEAIAIRNDLTKKVLSGKLLIGITIKDAKTLKEYAD